MTGADFGRHVCPNGLRMVKWACQYKPCLSPLFTLEGETMQPAHMRRRRCFAFGRFLLLGIWGVQDDTEV